MHMFQQNINKGVMRSFIPSFALRVIQRCGNMLNMELLKQVFHKLSSIVCNHYLWCEVMRDYPLQEDLSHRVSCLVWHRETVWS